MSEIFEGEDDSSTTAIGYTSEFLDAAVVKIDSVFGAGYAKANPALVGAFLQASATNLNAFMAAATAISGGFMDMLPEDILPPPPPPPPPRSKNKKWRP